MPDTAAPGKPKSPQHVAAGRAGAKVKWAKPEHRRVVRIDALPLEQRALVLAIVAAAEAARRAEK